VAQTDRLDRLERELASAIAEIDRLKSAESIRDCIYRICRATDRIDEPLFRSAFHPDAKVHCGDMYDGDAGTFIERVLTHQKKQIQVQHMVGNIRININGDEAVAESYELARHKSPVGGELKDLVLAMRTLDRFSRRNGEWRITDRTKVMDWGRIISGDEGIYNMPGLDKGRRDETDLSYKLSS
jgi:hypothetical protein